MNDDGVVGSGIRVANAKWRGAWFPRGILCAGIAFHGISDIPCNWPWFVSSSTMSKSSSRKSIFSMYVADLFE